MSSKLDLAWTTWVAVHRLRLASKCVRLLVQTAASAQRAQLCCELQEAWERRDHSLMWRLARKLGGKKNGPKKRFFNVPSSFRPSSSDWKDFLCGPREKWECEGVQAKWPPPEPLGLQNESIAESHHLERELLRRIMKELSGGNARRAVPSWSIPREIWLMLLRPPDARETITPAATEAELNNRLLQTTSSKEMLAIMREIRERQVANSEEQKTSRRHLPSTSKPCGIGYQTRPPLMKRFKAMISGLLGYIKELGIAPATWQRSSPVPLDKGTTKLGPARFRLVHLLCPFGKAFYGDLWRHRPHPCPRKVNTYAYSKGRRREAAILIQHMVRWRLTRGDVLAPIGTTMTGFDASNAFMSVHHTTLDKLVETSFEDERDRALMMQRYRGAQISLCANADEPRVEIVPSCGFFTRRRHWPFSF